MSSSSSHNLPAGESLDPVHQSLLSQVEPFQSPKPLYQVGDELTLIVGADHELAGQELKVTIKKILSMTMSCTLLVEVLSMPYPEPLVLKLFDRRVSQLLRTVIDTSNWTQELEDSYFTIADAQLSDQLVQWNADAKIDWRWWLPENIDYMDDIDLEAFLQHSCLDMYWRETRAYDLLQDLQGKQIPKVFASVSLPRPSKNGVDDDCFACKGLLLQYIDGFQLEYLEARAPPEQWQGVMDQVVQTVATARDLGMTNVDISPRNIMVSAPKSEDEGFKPFMIDLGGMRFRDQFFSDREFENELANTREETNLAYWMATKLVAKADGFYEVRVSQRAREIEEKWLNRSGPGEIDWSPALWSTANEVTWSTSIEGYEPASLEEKEVDRGNINWGDEAESLSSEATWRTTLEELHEPPVYTVTWSTDIEGYEPTPLEEKEIDRGNIDW